MPKSRRYNFLRGADEETPLLHSNSRVVSPDPQRDTEAWLRELNLPLTGDPEE